MAAWLTVVLSLLHFCNAAFDLAMGDDGDLESFVTRPELKAPKFRVTMYEPDEVDRGYWFVGPYGDIYQKDHAAKYYQACQTGPHIFDGDGNLVWSGACQFRNQNTCDFRAYEAPNGTSYLSAIVNFNVHTNDPVGRGVIMNSSYNFQQTIEAPPTVDIFNMHELKLIDDGKAALYITVLSERADLTNLSSQHRAGWIQNPGFEELDLETGEVTFRWHAYPHVSLEESTLPLADDIKENTWNWFHPNSVDKNADGDYLISGRYVDAIYKVSGRDGSVLWRLGGKRSDFALQGFNFSRQHDAQWIDFNDDYETISFLDNGGDEVVRTSNYTSALFVRLDKKNMSAHVTKRIVRPGERFSGARGNLQRLPSGHVFGGWSENCHISEHATDGRLLMEAEFASKRFVTYRAYKFNFTGQPQEPPAMKAFAYGLDEESAVTVYYVSWNGATEVSSWNFYREGSGDAVLIGSAARTGFETRLQARGYVDGKVFVEALDVHGLVLGRSLSTDITSYIDQAVQKPRVGASVAKGAEKTEL
ncbi:ASST-domain-containing protein [Neohortaea acidophila]|uniref:ASST-domain-containing protein n=1 Tax=Neohortaea acidophila TaxID=245834 RepID=A0A6A6PPF7_9PEZI|nr:ASST-domain-containing protein [Neohortaea acidophila]KAF2481514.1 ASST-domain-containing protein [Neohortaea acidophila]